MALAKKCDICGNLYENYNTFFDPEMEESNGLDLNVNGIAFVNIDEEDMYFAQKPIDCCPECMNKLKTHIRQMMKDAGNDKTVEGSDENV